MLKLFRITRNPEVGGVIKPTSVDFGGKLYLAYQCNGFNIVSNGFNIVIRKPAYTVWESRAQYGTDPARLMVGTLFTDGDRNTWVRLFWEKDTGRKWRSVMSEAIRVASTEKADLPKWGQPYATL